MEALIEVCFWGSAALLVYAYAGYPVLLLAIAGRAGEPRLAGPGPVPAVTLIIPVHNESSVIDAKIENTRRLQYPAGMLRVLFVSDGSSDGTTERIRRALDERTDLVELPTRGGKAAALNAGLARAGGEIVAFSDASIMLAPDALLEIVRPFADASIGCVSGEDRIPGAGGEALYGRYELLLRRRESRVHSIVGASGCFYAKRRHLCEPFPAGEAPDFFSVLVTVERGFRAVSAPRAVGTMTAISRPGGEFQRKVRTLLRGMTTLGRHLRLLDPFRHGVFSVELFSHKLLRWSVPFLLLALLVCALALAPGSALYKSLLAVQLAFYALAALGMASVPVLKDTVPVRVALFFTMTNAAVLAAWGKYAAGVRQEIWSPSRRS